MAEFVIIQTEADQKLPKSVGGSCDTIGARNSLGPKFLAAIGAHEYFSPEVSLIYNFICNIMSNNYSVG